MSLETKYHLQMEVSIGLQRHFFGFAFLFPGQTSEKISIPKKKLVMLYEDMFGHKTLSPWGKKTVHPIGVYADLC